MRTGGTRLRTRNVRIEGSLLRTSNVRSGGTRLRTEMYASRGPDFAQEMYAAGGLDYAQGKMYARPWNHAVFLRANHVREVVELAQYSSVFGIIIVFRRPLLSRRAVPVNFTGFALGS